MVNTRSSTEYARLEEAAKAAIEMFVLHGSPSAQERVCRSQVCLNAVQRFRHRAKQELFANHKTAWTDDQRCLLMTLYASNMHPINMRPQLQRDTKAIQYELARVLAKEVQEAPMGRVAHKYARPLNTLRQDVDVTHSVKQVARKTQM